MRRARERGLAQIARRRRNSQRLRLAEGVVVPCQPNLRCGGQGGRAQRRRRPHPGASRSPRGSGARTPAACRSARPSCSAAAGGRPARPVRRGRVKRRRCRAPLRGGARAAAGGLAPGTRAGVQSLGRCYEWRRARLVDGGQRDGLPVYSEGPRRALEVRDVFLRPIVDDWWGAGRRRLGGVAAKTLAGSRADGRHTTTAGTHRRCM